MTTDSPDSFHRITEVLSQSLEQAFDEVCPKRYGAPLEFQRIDDPSDPQTVTFGIEGPGTIPLEIHVTVTHVGGNVYDIAAQVEGDGPVRRFTYSEPADSGSSLSIAPYLGKKIATHVLDEVEQRLGKKLLRTQMKVAA
jgi:hypothetical protein